MSSRSILHALSHTLIFHFGRRKRFYTYVGAVLIVCLFFGFILLLPPEKFPTGSIITIEENASFVETARMLEAKHVVSSSLLMKVVARIGQADRNVQAGRYMFSAPKGVSSILHRIVNGISGMPVIRVTFPEGVAVRNMAEILEVQIPSYDRMLFMELAHGKEGYLFPDTYDFTTDSSAEDILKKLETTFVSRTAHLKDAFASFSHPIADVITMASLVEREGKELEDKRIIAGILWKRVDLGRALQVDAVFGYIHGTATYHPSLEDLEIDSPYNTYKYPGLPPGPIANPGLESIEAALTPIETDYLYYLTGTDGVMRYAETFEEHKQNRELYLK